MSSNNLSAEQIKILLYQYFLSNGDKYRSIAMERVRSSLRKLHPTSDDLLSSYVAMIYSDIFETIQKEIIDLLGM